MSKFEKAMSHTGNDVSAHTKSAVLDVADTMGMGALWFEDNGLEYTATDLLTFVSMVGMERQYILENLPKPEDLI